MFPHLRMMGINEKLRDDWTLLSPEEKAVYKTLPTPDDLSTAAGSSAPPVVAPVDELTLTSLESSPTPSTGTTALPPTLATTTSPPVPAPDSVLNSVSSSTPTASTLSSSATASLFAPLDRGQRTLQTCNICGKLFFDVKALDNHKRVQYSRVQTLTPARQALIEQEMDSSDNNDSNEAENPKVENHMIFFMINNSTYFRFCIG